MGPYPQETADLITFTEEILNWKLHFLFSVTIFAKYCILDIWQSSECIFEYVLLNAVKKTFHAKAVFVLNSIINISGYIWRGSWVPVLFLILVLFYLVLCFPIFISWYIYTLSVKISSVLILIGHNFRH